MGNNDSKIAKRNVFIKLDDENLPDMDKPVEVQEGDTVYSVKQKIFEIRAIEPVKQKLTYQGRMIDGGGG